jgi:hypothetical protein
MDALSRTKVQSFLGLSASSSGTAPHATTGGETRKGGQKVSTFAARTGKLGAAKALHLEVRILSRQARSKQAAQPLAPVYDRFTEDFGKADFRAANASIEGTS